MSACRQSGKPFRTMFMSIPFVYVHACCRRNKQTAISLMIFFCIVIDEEIDKDGK